VNGQDCLYAVVWLARERIEDLLLDEIAPLAREVRHHPDFHSLFYVRFSEPRWQFRFRVLGRPEWVRGALRDRLHRRLEELATEGRIEGHQFARYDRELERYGGEAGMELAERLFFLDSMAAIEWCAAERSGRIRKPRREIGLLVADRMADLAGLDRRQRLAFYRHGYAWALESGSWGPEELELLEQRFRKNQPGLDRLLDPSMDEAERWGGEESAAIARRFLEGAAPLIRRIVAEQTAGVIQQELVYLIWSYAHMFSNRLGIESSAESILRYFMHRHLEERRPVTA